MNTINPFKNARIEFHILQSFPVTCLNRDDVGSPKTAIVGGNTRARVSSQCWKRQVRLEMRELGVLHGTRTRLIKELIKQGCIIEGANEKQAEECGRKIANVFIADKKGKKSETESSEADLADDSDNDTLIFLSPSEVNFLALAFKNVDFNPDMVITSKDSKKQSKELEKLINSDVQPIDGVDIALFGRMVAKATTMNVEAAASFSHAISTHKVGNEVEFFTALDDLQTEPGAGHMGNLEFNSATYYRYVSIDLGQLWQSLLGIQFVESVEAFVKALFIAIPSARQTTLSGASPWEFAKIFVRKGQRLQVPFETSIQPSEGGYLQPSIEYLKSYLDTKEKLAGSLFRKEAEYTFGEDSNFSIDHLIADLKQYLSQEVKCFG